MAAGGLAGGSPGGLARSWITRVDGRQETIPSKIVTRLEAGDRVVTPVADGGSLYTVSAEVAAPETVRVPLGEFSAWNLKVSIVDGQGQAAWKNVAVWISNDARRLPVKLQAELSIGHFVLALREAR